MRRGAWLASGAVALAIASAAAAAGAQSPPSSPESIQVGDWKLSPTVSVRARGEYWRDPVDLGGGTRPDVVGPVSPRVRNGGGFSERARLGLGADRGPFRVKLTLQDARVWGALPPFGALGDRSALAQTDATEAWFEVHTKDPRPHFVRVGRQYLQLGDGRLLGSADWSPASVPLDAGLVRLTFGSWDFDAFAAIFEAPHPLGTSFRDPYGPSRAGQQLYGLSASWALDPLLKVQLLGLARVSRSAGVVSDGPRSLSLARAVGDTYTGSLRVHGDHKGWRYALEGAYQVGDAGALAPGGADREAYAAAAYLQKQFDKLALSPTLRLGGAFASGDDGTPGKFKQFDPILPDVHAFHGAMDIFAWSNVVEGNARATVVPWSDWTWAVEYRYAQLHEPSAEWLNAYLRPVGSAAGNTASDLGHEIDAVVTWVPSSPFELVMGYSLFVAGDGARTVLAAQGRGAPQENGTFNPVGLTHFGYLQATVRVP